LSERSSDVSLRTIDSYLRDSWVGPSLFRDMRYPSCSVASLPCVCFKFLFDLDKVLNSSLQSRACF
jgi:hypothetical protein